jgi:cell division protein FtsB
MPIATRLRRRLRSVMGPLLGLFAISYFAYHAVEGDRVLLDWWQLNRDVRQAEVTLAALDQERDALDRRARLLRPERLDPDMLEERARVMADLGHEDEVVILRTVQPH